MDIAAIEKIQMLAMLNWKRLRTYILYNSNNNFKNLNYKSVKDKFCYILYQLGLECRML